MPHWHHKITSQTWAYDNRNRLTSTSIYRANGVRIQSFDYTLHPTGRRTQITELNGRSSSYTYNNRYWLTGEAITDATNGNYSASYQYDNVGNRTQSIEDGVTTAYSYDQNDRITQQGGVVYSYDENGNTLAENDQGTLTDYSYNSQNKLVTHTASGLTTRYQYNADGIRHSKSDFLATTQFLVDANRDYAQVLAESIDGVTDVTYHFGDDLISQHRGIASQYFHTDGLGSTRVLTDGTGVTTDTYAYSAFGEVLNQTGITDNSYLYTGEQFDAGLDQYYLRARYYDQGVGRFTQMDTWMGSNQDPITLHKYVYAGNDPVLMIDQSGNSFTLSGVLTTINVVGSLSSAAIGGYRVGQLATGERELNSREVGITVLLLAAGPAAGKLAGLLGRKFAANSAGATAFAAGSVKLTEALIKRSLSGSQLVTRQKNVSIPKIERFVEDMLNGDIFPAIKVDGKVIVEGHHRYIASKIANVDIDINPGVVPNFLKDTPAHKLIDMVFSTVDY